MFQYDSDISFENIVLLRIENYILIGDFESAVYDYNKHGFDCAGNEIYPCLDVTCDEGYECQDGECITKWFWCNIFIYTAFTSKFSYRYSIKITQNSVK